MDKKEKAVRLVVAVELTEQGFDVDAEFIRRRVYRWIQKNVG